MKFRRVGMLINNSETISFESIENFIKDKQGKILNVNFNRSLIQNFKEEYRYLLNKISGTQDIIDKSK